MGIFIDENGPHVVPITTFDREGPDEWYDFLEIMGVVPTEAYKLYKNNTIFGNAQNKWPGIVRFKEKI